MADHKIYILFTDTGTLFTKLIKLYTKRKYNHASLSFDAGLMDVYSFGRKQMWNPFNGGFVKEDVRRGLFKNASCAIYSLTVTDEQMTKIKSFVQEFINQKENYRYNFLGLFGFIMNKPINRKQALFCSQFVATALETCSIVQFEKPTSLVAPGDLQRLPGLKLEYEGKLKDYHKCIHNDFDYVPISVISIEV